VESGFPPDRATNKESRADHSAPRIHLNRSRSGGEAGFTLMEMLVALLVMIAAATMLYRGFSGGLRAAATADGAEAALLVAQSRLAAQGIETPLAAGEQEGRDGAVDWYITVRPYGSANATAAPQAFWVTATVAWREKRGGRRSLHLTTLKPGGAP
jgi:general secretion pathway protein I